VHLVTRVHFRSRDKDGGYTIRSGVPENPILHANITTICLTERKLLPHSKFYIAEIEIFDFFGSCDLDLDPMTFVYELDQYSLEIYRMCKYELRTCQGFRKLSSDRQTYRHDQNYIPRHFVGGEKLIELGVNIRYAEL